MRRNCGRRDWRRGKMSRRGLRMRPSRPQYTRPVELPRTLPCHRHPEAPPLRSRLKMTGQNHSASRRERQRLLGRTLLLRVDLSQQLDIVLTDTVPAIAPGGGQRAVAQALHQDRISKSRGELRRDILGIHPDLETVDAVLKIFLNAAGGGG